MTIIEVNAGTRLDVTYEIHLAANPVDERVIVLHHGICHTREHFTKLIAALNAHGFHAAMIDQQLRNKDGWCNWIGLKPYRVGMAKAVRQIEKGCESPQNASSTIEEKHRPREILAYVCHSMGALFCEEMLAVKENEDLRRPIVFLAPMPVNGARSTSLRILCRHPGQYLWAVVTRSILFLVKTPAQTQEWFFDSRTEKDIYTHASERLRPASFLAYCLLLIRRWRGPRIVDDNQPKLLLISATDEIFHPWEFKKTRRRYPQMEEEHFKGGHDFFIEYAHPTADAITKFLRKLLNLVTEEVKNDAPELVTVASGSSVPPHHFDLQATTQEIPPTRSAPNNPR